MKNITLPLSEQALAGRDTEIPVTNKHFVTGNPIKPPFAKNLETAIFGIGCFWGAEKKFWQCRGVYSTAVGYSAGYTPNPSYEEVCTGLTGHNEVVLVVFEPKTITYLQLLTVFWESHNPTQGMRQGNDAGTQYRSGLYYFNSVQHLQAEDSKQQYQKLLATAGHAEITTEIKPASEFYYAEDYHQAYLAKNPAGYCGMGGLGVAFTLGQQ